MKQTSVVLLLFFSRQCYCQDTFTGFSESKKVRWAAHFTDTVRFKITNLSLLLRQKLNQGLIKAGTVAWDETIKVNKNVSKETIENNIAPNQTSQLTNESGAVIATVKEAEDPLLSSKYFDDDIKDLVEIAQVLYVTRGKLKSVVTWVSPKYYVHTSWNQKLGMANAFSTAFNYYRKVSSRLMRQSINLGSTSIVLVPDSLRSVKMIKQLYEHSLLKELWPMIAGDKFKMMKIDSAQSIFFIQLNQSLLGQAAAPVPVYDEEGKLGSYYTLSPQPLTAASFPKLVVEQEWYYHSKKNRLSARPTSLVLYATKNSNGQPEKNASPLLKIMLK